MQRSPPIAFDIPAQAVWRWLVGGIVGVSATVLAAWCLVPEQALGPMAQTSVAGAALLLWASAWCGSRTAACRLRWDGAGWWVGPAGCDDEHLLGGSLRVMIGLSTFMLLRFEVAPSGSPGVRWIPVLRSSLSARWHALSVAVYSARPDLGALVIGDLPRTALNRPEPHE